MERFWQASVELAEPLSMRTQQRTEIATHIMDNS
jgi:hypothetical protein